MIFMNLDNEELFAINSGDNGGLQVVDELLRFVFKIIK